MAHQSIVKRQLPFPLQPSVMRSSCETPVHTRARQLCTPVAVFQGSIMQPTSFRQPQPLPQAAAAGDH